MLSTEFITQIGHRKDFKGCRFEHKPFVRAIEGVLIWVLCGFIYRKWTYAIGNFYNVHHAAYNLPQSSTVEEKFSEDDTTLRNLTLVPSNCSIIIIFFFFSAWIFFFSFLCAMQCFPIPCAQTAKELLRYQIVTMAQRHKQRMKVS